MTWLKIAYIYTKQNDLVIIVYLYQTHHLSNVSFSGKAKQIDRKRERIGRYLLPENRIRKTREKLCLLYIIEELMVHKV
jgi:hypothetical protein